MIDLIDRYIRVNQKAIDTDPILYATIMALRDYVEAGNALSNHPWFKAINFSAIEGRQRLQKAA